MVHHKLSLVEIWDLSAKDYDSGAEQVTGKYLLDLLTTSGFINKLQHSSSSSSSVKALDIAGGNGLLPLAVLSNISSLTTWNKDNFSLLCTDFSKGMIEIASENLKQSHFSHTLKETIQFRVMDGQNLELESNTFDFAFSNFGIFLFVERKKGLEEMYRVVKSGGIGALTAWTPNYFSKMADLHDRMATHEDLKIGPNMFRTRTIGFADENQIHKELQEVGFQTIKVTRVAHNFTFSEIDAAVQFFCRAFSLDKSEEYKQKYFATYGKELKAMFWNATTNRIEIPWEAFLIVAEK